MTRPRPRRPSWSSSGGSTDRPDTDDIPPAPAENWKNARRFSGARPRTRPGTRKEPISIRLDADVLDWLRGRGPGYQSEINRFLRERMEAEATVRPMPAPLRVINEAGMKPPKSPL